MALIRKAQLEPNQNEQRATQRDVEALIERLDDGDAAVRRWAARDLTDHPSADHALVKRLMIEKEHSVREVILTALTRLHTSVAVAGLVSCLRNDDASLRNEAIEAMKALPDEMAPIIGALLNDPDQDVRILTVNVLESLRHPMVEAWLIDVIERDPMVNVCATAVDLLGEVGSRDALRALQLLKQRFASEPYIQFAADLALQRIAKD